MALMINGISLPVRHGPEALPKKICTLLRIPEKALLSYTILKQSLDARKKSAILYHYTVKAAVKEESKVLKRCRGSQVCRYEPVEYKAPEPGELPLSHRPVIVGEGPAGLFAGLLLAKAGYRPIILERGEQADRRKSRVQAFWDGGPLDPESNVSFGEGGAGTFSDGKLNTLVKDSAGRNNEVLRTLVRFGADPEILWQQKPHVGTDRLIRIVTGMRQEIERLGGEVRFGFRVEHLSLREGALAGVSGTRRDEAAPGGRSPFSLDCEALVLATGHSARDTFSKLLEDGLRMEPKSFAVGLRVQHPQSLIDRDQFGEQEAEFLSPAAYKLTAKSSGGRGVYTFCMCPGGYVVNASSEPGRTAVNGMSYHDRASGTANSAVIVAVTPEDFLPYGEGPLAGLKFQEAMEERAFRAGDGAIPVQRYGDFRESKVSEAFGRFSPCFRGGTRFADLRPVLGETLSRAFEEGMEQFGQKLPGFSDPDTVLAGVESRTSSPVRIPRGEDLTGSVPGVYPCGEGAGYAGGITSAAMDGLRCAEALIRRFAPCPGA